MTARDWSIEGRYVEFCNCDLGCPCESMAEPREGYCTGAVAFQVDKGHCDGVSLDGMKVVATFYFPRAIHHGNGHMQPILEDTISEGQKEAIFYILGGEAKRPEVRPGRVPQTLPARLTLTGVAVAVPDCGAEERAPGDRMKLLPA